MTLSDEKIYLIVLSKRNTNLNNEKRQDSRFPGQDLNPRPLEKRSRIVSHSAATSVKSIVVLIHVNHNIAPLSLASRATE